MGLVEQGEGSEDLAEVHPATGEGKMNSYQRRLGLLLGSTALLILVVSSGAQSTIGYARFAYAVSQVTGSCANFSIPSTMQIVDGGQSALPYFLGYLFTPRNITIEGFQLGSLYVYNDAISASKLDLIGSFQQPEIVGNTTYVNGGVFHISADSIQIQRNSSTLSLGVFNLHFSANVIFHDGKSEHANLVTSLQASVSCK